MLYLSKTAKLMFSIILLFLGSKFSTLYPKPPFTVANLLKNNETFDIVICNAAVLLGETIQKTSDNYEAHFGINYLGHFTLLVSLLNQKLASSRPKRIVIVSSCCHIIVKKSLFFEDLGWENGVREKEQGLESFRRDIAYAESKLQLILLAKKLSQICDGININIAMPGPSYTSLISNFGHPTLKFFYRTPKQASQTILYLGFSEDEVAKNTSGKYFENCKIYENNLSEMAKSEEQMEKLWEVSCGMTGLSLVA